MTVNLIYVLQRNVNADINLAKTFIFDSTYHSFRFIQEGCGENTCPEPTEATS
jgi:hypothetical protein